MLILGLHFIIIFIWYLTQQSNSRYICVNKFYVYYILRDVFYWVGFTTYKYLYTQTIGDISFDIYSGQTYKCEDEIDCWLLILSLPTVNISHSNVPPKLRLFSYKILLNQHFLRVTILPISIMFKCLVFISLAFFGITCQVSNIILIQPLTYNLRSNLMMEVSVLMVLMLP